MLFFSRLAKMRLQYSASGLSRLDPRAEEGVLATRSSRSWATEVRSTKSLLTMPRTACFAPRIFSMNGEPRSPSTQPTRDWLMTAVGPPDWPMTALPLRSFPGELDMVLDLLRGDPVIKTRRNDRGFERLRQESGGS